MNSREWDSLSCSQCQCAPGCWSYLRVCACFDIRQSLLSSKQLDRHFFWAQGVSILVYAEPYFTFVHSFQSYAKHNCLLPIAKRWVLWCFLSTELREALLLNAWALEHNLPGPGFPYLLAKRAELWFAHIHTHTHTQWLRMSNILRRLVRHLHTCTLSLCKRF